MQRESRKIRSVYLPGLLTTHQVAAALGVRSQYIHRLRELGLLTAVMMIHDELLLFKEGDVSAYKSTHPHLGTRRKKNPT